MEVKRQKLQKYFEKVKEFCNCAKYPAWIENADLYQANLFFDVSVNIEETLSLFKSNLPLKFKNVHPNLDLEKASEKVLELFLHSSVTNADITMHIIRRYINHHSKKQFVLSLQKIINTRKYEECLLNMNISMSSNVVKSSGLTNIEVKAVWTSWEEQFCCQNKNLKVVIIEMLEKEPIQLLLILKEATNHNKNFVDFAAQILSDYLNSHNQTYSWKLLINKETLPIITSICEVPGMIKIILLFFRNYSRTVESIFDDDLNSKWHHSEICFEDFIEIVSALKNFAKVKEFMDDKMKIESDGFLFWTDVMTQL